jgi:hypothetical protein
MSNNIESPEITFMTKIHEMTSNADKLIEIYTESLVLFEALADTEFPNRKESIELLHLTVDTILELKVAVTSLTEHSAEMNDAITDAVAKLESRKE